MANHLFSGLATLLSTLVVTGAAYAQEPVTVTFEAPPTAALTGQFTVALLVRFPAGDYTNTRVQLQWSPAAAVASHASPTTQEFDNAQGIAGVATTLGRQWIQQNPFDLTGGASVRRFEVTLTTSSLVYRTGTPLNFTATVLGDVADTVGGTYAPIVIEDQLLRSTTVTFTGTNGLGWLAYGGGRGGGPILAEGTDEPGLMRRFVIDPRAIGTARLDAPTTISASFGAGYTFIRAFGNGYSTNPSFMPNPDAPHASLIIDSQPEAWTTGAGNVEAHIVTENAGIGLYIDLFVPCSAFGKTAQESAAQGTSYTVSGSAHAQATDYEGQFVGDYTLNGTPLGSPLDLTLVCGGGGGLTKAPADSRLSHAGTRASWGIGLTPPFGVTEIRDAMVVDLLPADIVGLIALSGALNNSAFQVWVCDLGGAGYIDTATFLARRDTDCRSGYGGFQVGDTHLVYYAPIWSDPDGALLAATFRYITVMSAAYVAAHPGGTLQNTAYFNGDVQVFPDVGDQVPETASEDPWEARATSPAIPTTALHGVVVDPCGSVTSAAPIDANAGAGHMCISATSGTTLYPSNPSLSLNYPEGIIVTSVTHGFGTACTTDATTVTSPGAGPWSTPLRWSAGDASTDPWTMGVEGCTFDGRVNFIVDPNYPWIDRQRINFSGTATTTEAGARSDSAYWVARVATGMDVLLEGDCWTDASPIAPPQPGLQLFEATAVNRGSVDLDDIELRFIVPADGVYRTAVAGPDLPLDAIIEVSRNGGSSWSVAPTSADPTVTDVRVTGIDILGEGVDAKRPSFYVGIIADGPTALVEGGAWAHTWTAELGQTPTKTASVDASQCAVPCNCPDPTPNDACSTGGCDATGACIAVNADEGSACTIEGDLCVTAAACQSGSCTPTATTACNDQDTCSNDRCDSSTGACVYSDVYDCTKELPIYLPIKRDGKVIGAVRCSISGGRLRCDTDGEKLKLYDKLASACGL